IKSDAGTVSIYVDTDPTGTPTKGNINLGQSEKLRTVIFSDADMDEFEEGWHTVYVKAHNGGWVNFDGIFVKKTNDVDDAGDRLMLTNASGRGDTVNFSYRKTGFQGYEVFAEYRTVGGSWIRSEQSFADLTGSVTVLDGTSVQLRLVAVKGEDVQYSPAWVVNLLEVKPGVLYFVDAGTGTEGELSTGAVLGEYQGLSDKAYGEDAATGLKWGYTNSIKTAYEGTEDAMTSVMSLDGTGESALTYKFTMPEAGTYNLALGFYGGGKDWGSRTEAISVTGATLVADTNEITLTGGSYNAWYATITTSEANAEVTVSLAKKNATEDEPMVSVIVITEENVSIPLYTSGASNYNSASIVSGTDVALGADLFAEIEETDVTVYLSDGTTAKISAEEEGVSYTVSSPVLVAGQDVKATFVSKNYPGLEVYAHYTWHQEGAMVLYYNIDCGKEAGTMQTPGSKQSTANDLMYHEDTEKGTSWGYDRNTVGSVNWADSGSEEWSIRGDANPLTYKMTGFKPNELLIIETGGHCGDNWGGRTYKVECNNAEIGRITLENGKRTYKTFPEENATEAAAAAVKADANGEVTLKFTKTQGGDPHVGYIKVWSRGGTAEKCAPITSDRATVARDGAISLRSLEIGATVYILDENNYILGSFVAETATQSIVVADYLPATSFSLHFVQAMAGTVDTQRDVSEELVVDVPGVTYTIVNEDVKEGEELVLTFQPHANGGVTAVTITPPGGVAYDLTEGFYYRAKTNGDYKVTIVANGVVSSQIITITSFADFKEVYSSEGWTADDLTLTFDPSVYGTVTSVIVNGEAIAVNNEGKYVYTATRNGTYSVTVLTKEGYEYVKEYVVTNIDKVTPHLELTFDYTVASNISLGYETLSASGGTLYVSHDGGAREAVTDHDTISLALAGKYEITFANGAGVETQTNVYYVTYGLDKATLASVTRGDDGAISVTGSTVNTKLYRAGETNETASMKAVKAGKYYLELDNGAEKEIVVFNVAAGNVGGDINNPDDGGSSAGSAIMIAGIVIGCVAIAAAAAVCPVVILKGRKRS
ncbi:MAG: hypothetical protein K2L87_04000, partial [Clostridiales bacterium]|nr:hypothetical protein [Clostridiales bacterium]